MIKFRRLPVLVFGIFLLLAALVATARPTFAGHTAAGGVYCSPCGTAECLCDDGELPIGYGRSSVSEDSTEAPVTPLIILGLVVLLWLRIKATS